MVDVNKKNDLENKITSLVVSDRAIRKQAIVDIIPPSSSDNPADEKVALIPVSISATLLFL